MGLGSWLREYRRVGQLEKELAEWKSRALRAEESWQDRQKEIMKLSMDLRNEKLKVQSVEISFLRRMIKLLQNASKRFMKMEGVSVQYPLCRDEHGKIYFSRALVAMHPLALIDALTEILHTDRQTLLAKLGVGSEVVQQMQEGHVPPAKFSDNFSDIGSRLYAETDLGECGGRFMGKKADKP